MVVGQNTTDDPPMMEELVKGPYDRLHTAIIALHNAFGYDQDPSDPAFEHDVWSGAASSAQNVADIAEELAEASWAIARLREDAMPDE